MVIIQSGLITQIPNEIGSERNNAVKADNCWGEKFFVLNIGTKISRSRKLGRPKVGKSGSPKEDIRLPPVGTSMMEHRFS